MGPSLFTMYAGSISKTVPTGTDLYGYADDHSLSRPFLPATPGLEELSLLNLSSTMEDIQHWMDSNRLKFNPAKTEFIYFGSRNSLNKTLKHSVKISRTMIHRTETVKYLGITMDESLSFHQQVTNVCVKAMLNLARIRSIRSCLSIETCQILIQALVLSHLDYGNVCYIRLLKKDIDRLLQCVQNQAAKVVLKAGRMDSSRQCLKDLHWLPCQQRIHYKVLLIVHTSVHAKGPQYLQELFHQDTSRRSQRTTDLVLQVPFTTHKTFADRSISIAGYKLWNQLLDSHTRLETNTEQFKKSVKTILFQQAFAE